MHELCVDEVGFSGVEEVHDGQDVAAVFEALKAVRDCWESQLSEIELNFGVGLLILGLGLVFGVVEELLVVDDIEINFEEAFSLGQLMVGLGLEGLFEIEESLLGNGVSFILE